MLLSPTAPATAQSQPVLAEYGIYVPNGQTKQETRFDCWNITNNSPTGAEVYVPLNMRDEWDGPYGIKTRPPEGVTFAACSGRPAARQGGNANAGPARGNTVGTGSPIGSGRPGTPVSPASTGSIGSSSPVVPDPACVGSDCLPPATPSCNGTDCTTPAATNTANDYCDDRTGGCSSVGSGSSHQGSLNANGNPDPAGSFDSVSNPTSPTNSTATSGDPTGGTPGNDAGGSPSGPDGGSPDGGGAGGSPGGGSPGGGDGS